MYVCTVGLMVYKANINIISANTSTYILQP